MAKKTAQNTTTNKRGRKASSRPTTKASGEPKIDREFKQLIPPPTKEEFAKLEMNLQEYGCRDAIVVWKGKNIILDGHNRFEICKKKNILYETNEVELEDRDAARLWIINNQLARRNLSSVAYNYLRGQQYNLEKKRHGGVRGNGQASSKNCDLVDESAERTCEQLAKKFKVSAKTIQNDGKLAENLDRIGTICGNRFRDAILRGDIKATQSNIQKLSELENDDSVKEVVTESLTSGTLIVKGAETSEASGVNSSDDSDSASSSDSPSDTVSIRQTPQKIAAIIYQARGAKFAKSLLTQLQQLLA